MGEGSQLKAPYLEKIDEIGKIASERNVFFMMDSAHIQEEDAALRKEGMKKQKEKPRPQGKKQKFVSG
jgi:hypothetical protein